jgi:hypothetical protein
MNELIKKADVLIEALPYIRQFSDKIVVIKYGIFEAIWKTQGELEPFLGFRGADLVIFEFISAISRKNS